MIDGKGGGHFLTLYCMSGKAGDGAMQSQVTPICLS